MTEIQKLSAYVRRLFNERMAEAFAGNKELYDIAWRLIAKADPKTLFTLYRDYGETLESLRDKAVLVSETPPQWTRIMRRWRVALRSVKT